MPGPRPGMTQADSTKTFQTDFRPGAERPEGPDSIAPVSACCGDEDA